MLFHFLSRCLKGRSANAQGKRRPARQPQCRQLRRRLVLEELETRTLLSSSALAAGYGNLPLAFEANQGQAAAQVNFLAHGNGYNLDLTPGAAVLNLNQGSAQDTVTIQLVGANLSAPAAGLNELITKSNYLIGNDPSQWHTNIPNFGRVEYQGIYPGVDVVYYGNQGQLEYDFTVAPGADPGIIQLSIQGAQNIALDAQGNLVLHTADGDVVEQAPVVYQQINGSRQAVSGRFVLEGNNQVGFQVGAYDHSQPLVIDPTLSYSTYLSSGNYRPDAIAVDGAGNAYVTGQGAFVDKLNAAGTALIYSTQLGGGLAGAIAVDSAGDAYITGEGSGVPTTANAYSNTGTGFVTELDPTGSGLVYSTLLPGISHNQSVQTPLPRGAIAIDGSGNIYVTGSAGPGLPTPGGYQANYVSNSSGVNAFFAEINPHLSGSASLVYATYLGGSGSFGDTGTGIAVDTSGNAYLTGWTSSSNFPTTAGAFQRTYGGGFFDVFVAKFNPGLSGSASLLYSTYLGGKGADGYVSNGEATWTQEVGPGIAVDSAGDAYVAGGTNSTNFRTTRGAFQTTYQGPKNQTGAYAGDAFVTKLNPSGTGLVYSTYLGGKDMDAASSIALDGSGNAYVTGWTRSTNFPTVNPIQAQKVPGGTPPNSDVFVTTLNSTGSNLLFSTYFGGSGEDYGYGIALDPAANAYVTGWTFSTDFPTTTGAVQTSGGGFVFKIDPPAEGAAVVPGTGGDNAPTRLAKESFFDAGSLALVGWPVASSADRPGNSNAGSRSVPAETLPDQVLLQVLSDDHGKGHGAASSPASGHATSPEGLDKTNAPFV
jgi:hypothetical protein